MTFRTARSVQRNFIISAASRGVDIVEFTWCCLVATRCDICFLLSLTADAKTTNQHPPPTASYASPTPATGTARVFVPRSPPDQISAIIQSRIMYYLADKDPQ